MRVKTSVTIDEKVLRGIDRVVTREKSRSRIIEDAARDYLTQRARLARDSRDREIIDRAADGLNAEMEDVLSYQVDL
jgi:metal-responsive CopG/Arc/MetJ family transcriptional regulator